MRTPTPARSGLGHIATHKSVLLDTEHIMAARVASERTSGARLHHIGWTRRVCYDIEVEGEGEELVPVRLDTLYRALRVSRSTFCSAARGISIRLPKGSHVRRTDAQTALRRRMAVRGGHRAGRSECLAAVVPVEPCLVRTQGALRRLERCSDKAADLASASGRRTRRGASAICINLGHSRTRRTAASRSPCCTCGGGAGYR